MIFNLFFILISLINSKIYTQNEPVIVPIDNSFQVFACFIS